jgi:hypothetical protein
MWWSLSSKVNGLRKSEIARRTVPCFKYVVEPDGERLALCLLIDSKYLYRYPYESTTGLRSLAVKARYLKGEMEDQRLREFQPGLCRYVRPRSQAVPA